MLPTAAAEQRTASVPQKNTRRLEEVAIDPVNRGTTKRPSEAADIAQENNPKTPVTSKRIRVGVNQKSSRVAPIRRTGK